MRDQKSGIFEGLLTDYSGALWDLKDINQNLRPWGFFRLNRNWSYADLEGRIEGLSLSQQEIETDRIFF